MLYMSPDNEKKLIEKYPKIFRNFQGFECGDGWFDLIDKLCSEIQPICDREKFQTVATQVKEKFGGLRFYVVLGQLNDEILNKILEAEQKSQSICETCGNAGKIVKYRGYYYCSCPEHIREGSKLTGRP